MMRVRRGRREAFGLEGGSWWVGSLAFGFGFVVEGGRERGVSLVRFGLGLMGEELMVVRIECGWGCEVRRG